MYYLMNKDIEVASFTVEKGVLADAYKMQSLIQEKLPIGFNDINRWIENRKGSKHNEHLRKLMVLCGCEKNEGFIRITHATSLNDTFWIKSDEEDIRWEQVSLYKNEFNEVISRLAFEGIGLYGVEFSSTSPELSTEGSFRKCWRRENNEIFLYKRGQSGARNLGLEPYCEVMASELARALCGVAISYDLTRLHREIVSRCKLFTSETVGYVPFARFGLDHSPDEILSFYRDIGAEDEFRRMIVLDSLTFNIDRHAGNHGVLVDNDTSQILSMAPVFDMNLSLLPYTEKEEFDHIGDKLLEYTPRIGDDFTRLGQQILTSDIRSALIGLKGFQFSFRGDEKFPEWRVKILEHLIEQQIEALLSRHILYTKDVFVPRLLDIAGVIRNDNLAELEICARRLGEELINQKVFHNYGLNIEEETVILRLETGSELDEQILINMKSHDIWAEVEGNEVSLAELSTDYPDLSVGFEYAAKHIDNV